MKFLSSIMIAKSNFRNGGDSLRGIEANRQVCPTISEITFGKQSSRTRPVLMTLLRYRNLTVTVPRSTSLASGDRSGTVNSWFAEPINGTRPPVKVERSTISLANEAFKM